MAPKRKLSLETRGYDRQMHWIQFSSCLAKVLTPTAAPVRSTPTR